LAKPKGPENETPSQKWKRLSSERMAKRIRPAFRVMQNLTSENNYEATEEDWKPVILELRVLLGRLEDAASIHADKTAIIAEKREREAQIQEQREKERQQREKQSQHRPNVDRWAA
jgi:hypothetical protein